jgi:hypothetical protein
MKKHIVALRRLSNRWMVKLLDNWVQRHAGHETRI